MNERLELMAMANGFKVEEFKDGWEISSEDFPLMAFIRECGYVEYYMTDVHKVTCDIAEIEMDTLMKLKALCEEVTSWK